MSPCADTNNVGLLQTRITREVLEPVLGSGRIDDIMDSWTHIGRGFILDVAVVCCQISLIVFCITAKFD